jgi:hypothetical protein
MTPEDRKTTDLTSPPLPRVTRLKRLRGGGIREAVRTWRFEPLWGQTPEPSPAINTIEPHCPRVVIADDGMRTQAIAVRTDLLGLRERGASAAFRFPHGAVSFKRDGPG